LLQSKTFHHIQIIMQPRLTRIAFFIAAVCVLYSVSSHRTRYSQDHIIWGDVEGYYCYLPMMFVDHGCHHLNLRTSDLRRNSQNEEYSKYTCGLSYFFAPFFVVAHIVSKAEDLPATGYGLWYYRAVCLCCAVWTTIGMLLLIKLLMRHFQWFTAWITAACLFFGTNYFHYATRYVGMAHVYDFALVAWLLYLYQSFLDDPKWHKSVLMASLAGWLVLIRPTNVEFLLFLPFLMVNSKATLQERWVYLRANVKAPYLLVLLFFLPMVPQFVYWKEMTGHWVMYSYQQETFCFWKSPKILEVLFDTQNGLLLYSPILLLLFFGLVRYRKDARTNAAGVSILFCVITYTFASWWAWFFGAAYGHRCYIDYYPVLAFPMAVAIERTLAAKKPVSKIILGTFLTLMCFYNIRMSFQFEKTGIWDGKEWQWNYGRWWHEVQESCL
jgi:hypothetical protein